MHNLTTKQQNGALRGHGDLRSVLEHKRQCEAGFTTQNRVTKRRPLVAVEPENNEPSTVRLPGTSRHRDGFVLYVNTIDDSEMLAFFKNTELLASKVGDLAKEGMQFLLLSASDKLYGVFKVSRPATFKESDDYQVPVLEVSYKVEKEYLPLEAVESGLSFQKGLEIQKLGQFELSELIQKFQEKQARMYPSVEDLRRRPVVEAHLDQDPSLVMGPPLGPPPRAMHGNVALGFGGPIPNHLEDIGGPPSSLHTDWIMDSFPYSDTLEVPRSTGVPIDPVTYSGRSRDPVNVSSARGPLDTSFSSFQSYAVPVHEAPMNSVRPPIEVDPRHSYLPYNQGVTDRRNGFNSMHQPVSKPRHIFTAKKVSPARQLACLEPVRRPASVKHHPPRVHKDNRADKNSSNSTWDKNGINSSWDKNSSNFSKRSRLAGRISEEPTERISVFERVSLDPPENLCFSPVPVEAVLAEPLYATVKKPKISASKSVSVRDKLPKYRVPVVEALPEDKSDTQIVRDESSSSWNFKRRSCANNGPSTVPVEPNGGDQKRRRIKRPDFGLADSDVKP